MEDELLTIAEVAGILKVHKSHIYALMRDGELSVVKKGKRFTRILRSDLVTYIERHRLEARPKEETQ